MNTDNMALSGETIDYGPCAFMDAYDPTTVFSSIDSRGRYAYGNQPPIAQWNLARLAEAMLPLIDADEARAVERATASLDRFRELFERAVAGRDAREARAVHRRARRQGAGRRPARVDAGDVRRLHEHVPCAVVRSVAAAPADADPTFAAWHARLLSRRARQPQPSGEVEALMRRHNPAYIPRNHKVEEALAAATTAHDFSVMTRLLEVLRAPYDYEVERPEFSAPPSSGRPYRTFCGT